jgi:PAS domain S-box-containing protein
MSRDKRISSLPKHDSLSPGDGLRVRSAGGEVGAHREHDRSYLEGDSALLASLEFVEHGLCVVDRNLDIAGFNSRLLEILDLPAGYIAVGRPFEDIVRHMSNRGATGPAELEMLVNEQVRETQPGLIDPLVVERTWSCGRTFDIRYNPMPGGGFVAVYRDTSDRKAAETRLREGKTPLRDFLDTATDVMWETDADHRFVDVSAGDEWVQHRAYTSGFLGKTRWELAGGDPGVDPAWRAHVELLSRREEFRDLEYSIPDPTREGQRIHLRSSGKPIFGPDGGFLGYRGTASNVTDMVEAERRAEASSVMLADALDALPIGIGLFDGEDRLVASNASYRSTLASQPEFIREGISYEQICRMSVANGVFEGVAADDEAWIVRRVEAHRHGGTIVDQQLHDGRWLRMEERRTSRGGIVALRTDITDLKNRENDLENATRLLRLTLESMDQGIGMVDENLRVILFNKRILDLLGIPRDRFAPGTPLLEFVRCLARTGTYGDESPESTTARIMRHVRADDRPGHSEIQRPDGMMLDIRRLPISQGGFVSVVTDVTERRHEETRRKEAESRLRTVLDNMPVVLWTVDAEGVVTFVEGKALETLGAKPGQRIGNTIVGGVDSDRTGVQATIRRALAGETLTDTWDIGGVLFETRVTPLAGTDGRITGVLGVSLDVTERSRTQNQLIQTSKLATLGEMATSLAHELNQPLNVIRMAAESTIERLDDGGVDPDTIRRKLDRISRQTVRAASIIDHMRIFGRKSVGREIPFDPREAVVGALGIIGERLRLHGIEVVTRFVEECPPVLGHLVQMEQVVLNILSNAFDALDGSDGASPKRICISVRAPDSSGVVDLEFEDNGGGIRPDILDRVFEPFMTTKDIGRGTGLGLSISYGIITEMGGTIGIANVDGGTRVTISLPVTTTRPGTQDPASV